MLPVDFQTVGLAIGSVRPTDVGAFVPIQAEPLEIGNELIFKAGFATFDVSVFDPQQIVPPCRRAKSQLNNAVRALPTWSCPVGEGANRTRIEEFEATERC